MQFKWKLIALTGMMMQLLTYANAQQPAVIPEGNVRFTIKEAVDYALVNQYAVRNAKLDELNQLAVNKEVSGRALPQLSGTATYLNTPVLQKQFVEAKQFIPTAPPGELVALAFGLKHSASGALDLNQVLFDPSVLVALQARKTLEELARKGVAKSEIDVKTEVYKAYYNVLAADKALQILQESVLRLEKTLNETKETYKNGLVEKLDVDRLVVQYNNLKSEELRIRNVREVGLAALKFQMGMPMKQQLELTDTLSTEVLKAAGIEDQNSFAYSNRIEYQLAETQKKANEYNLKRYRMEGLPSLNLFAQTGANRQSTKFDFVGSELWYGWFNYGLSLKVPIFSGFQRKRRVDQAFIAVQKSDLTLENTRNMIDLDQTQSSINLRNNITTLENQEENMKLANEVYSTSNIKYKEGVGSSLEVITAETALLTAQNNYFSALFNVIVSRIDYLKAYGKL
jgi:outer membrane protein